MTVFERILERQLEEVARIADEAGDASGALAGIVRHHLAFTVEHGERLATWRKELRDLPAEDAWRLRRMQRLYVEEWVDVLGHVRPDLGDGEARTAVHAMMALLQSPAAHRSGLPSEAIVEVLSSMALAAFHGVKGGASPRPQP